MQEITKLYKNISKYQHVERIGNSEVQGILQGTVWIQEKLDGANLTVAWDSEESDFIICSRKNPVYHSGKCHNKGFQPVIDYILNEQSFKELFTKHPHVILRGEYLTKHKIPIKPEFDKKFVIFDVEQAYCGQDEDINESPRYAYVPYRNYQEMVGQFPDLLWLQAIKMTNPGIEDLQLLVALESKYMEYREGIVIKNYNYVNKYGRVKWAKMINPQFDEKKAIKAKSVPDGALEQVFVDKFITAGYVEKEICKIRDEKGDVSVKDMGRIIGIIPYEAFQDEMWSFLHKHNPKSFQFGLFKRLAIDKVRQFALEYFNNYSNV